jgi:hypothetical protein
MKLLTHFAQCIFTLYFLCTPLTSAQFYPAEWIRQDLNLAQFFVYYGEGEERIRTLQEILEHGCATGNVKYIHWVIEKQQETGLSLYCDDIVKSLEKLMQGGFDEILCCIPNLWNIYSLSKEQKSHLVDSALEIGYPSTALVLEKIGCTLSLAQQKRLSELQTILVEEPLAVVPVPINFAHHHAHGGDENQHIYHREYRIAVSFVLHQMQEKPCDFLKLIENLGHRRRRMAALGKLNGVELYGSPTNQQMITYFKQPYDEYGRKIHEKYPLLPFSVKAQLNGRTLYLTQINEDSWLHPDGDHRAEILQEIVSICQRVHTTFYPPEMRGELMHELGKIIWWMSHAPPFLRGTPTILFILIDAFWIYHGFIPPSKSLDLNCEALTFDDIESFATYANQL